MKTGIEYITQERKRQIFEEDWDGENDDKYRDDELPRAAVAYATPAGLRLFGLNGLPNHFPFDKEWWKPSPDDRIKELSKAGALIAAEIDRLEREKERLKFKGVKDRLIGIYFRICYTGFGVNSPEDWAWLDNNTFKCVVTEKTMRNGYDSDKEQVKSLCVLGEPYTLESMDVSQSSSSLTLKEFPNERFNTSNFEIYIDNGK